MHLTKPRPKASTPSTATSPFFGSLTDFMSSGPCVVMALEAPDAIKKWRTLMGATDPAKADAGTMRKDFGDVHRVQRHARLGRAGTAAFELGYFFRGMELACDARRTRSWHCVIVGRSSLPASACSSWLECRSAGCRAT